VEAFANDIRAFQDWRPVQARSGDAWYRTRKFLRRYRVPVAAVLLLLMGLSLGLYEVNRERAVAQRRFQQVRQLANKVMALDNVIEPLLGSTKARQEIVAMSKEYLEGLGVEAHADPDLALEVGTAYTALARVQGVPNRQNLGEYAEAEESLIKAESFIDAVLTASPQNRSALLKSAEVNHDRMILADNAHRHEAVLDHARKAAARVDGVLALGSTSSYEMRRAALIFGNIALVHKNQHLYEDSVRYARRSIEVAGTVPTLQQFVGSALSVIADSLRYLGDLDGALKAIREARKAVERADFQNEPNRLSTTFSLLWREGMILGADGQISLEKPDEAIIVLQKAFDLIEDWVKKDADSASGRILFTQGGRELGNILVHHDPQRALAIFDHALLRLGEVKNNAKARRSEAQLLACSSYALRRLNRVNEAGQRIDTAFKLLRETKDYPAERINSDDETETVVRAWGAHLAETGQPQRAADVYEELLDGLMAWHPDPNNDLRHATSLSRIYEALSSLELRNGQTDHAQTMSALRLEIWRNWDHKLPRVSFVHRQLDAASRP